jgi:Protein of unknown function (DUF1592)/Protein of unknown function (DUF1588)/Protein of unknown function (DUF1587)/Protein of unknown function (DUF1585)/Protein of unknown function (DUF1595)/Planctomycete cytochrome C
MLRRSPYLVGLAVAAVVLCNHAARGQSPEAELTRRFADDVLPVMRQVCLDCHGEKQQEAKLNLAEFERLPQVVDRFRIWEEVATRMAAREMPPDSATRQPTDDQRRAVVEWIRDLGKFEAERHAGDPGAVLARRLSNAEYDRSIRDLTGRDLRPTREFPVDPANEAGFDNSGESLTTSPALFQKSLAAARWVAEHLVLLPEGFEFAPYPVVAETDRDHYCVHRIVDFYKQHAVDLADYFVAAWYYKHRVALGRPTAALEDVARVNRLSERYLKTVWKLLESTAPATGVVAQVRTAWQAFPSEAGEPGAVRQAAVQLRDLVQKLRKEMAVAAPKMQVKGISDGSQPFVLWRNRLVAENRLKPPAVTTGAPTAGDDVVAFCQVFPDMFVYYDRAPYFDPNASGQGRLLTAGFHLMQGYFRDDRPLYELVLSDEDRREVDRLWRELDFITLAPIRQYKDFIFFERAEPPRYMVEARFDFARAEDKDCITAAKLERLHHEYRDKAQSIGAHDEALAAIDLYFKNMAREIRWVEDTQAAAEPTHLAALQRFAERAYRRPLEGDERQELIDFYHRLRKDDGLTHEEALRDALASVLLSPYFCYRFDLAAPGAEAVALTPYELASRLSYFLWSSLPDEELLSHAASGDLTRPAVIAAQSRRMVNDARIRALAEEFGGNWLDIRRFGEHNAVDRERFPAFTPELRDAMYEEPIRFLIDAWQQNRPVTEMLYARHTFVNAILAKHYGMSLPTTTADQWVRVDHADQFDRGGLLTMAVFLTKNAPGLRTSPVKRGYWVVRRLLGERIPPPPPEVPELPKDEAALGELTLPQLLARHREHKACAGCHQRFDSVGLAFEGFGPIGERRAVDLGGKPIINRGEYPDGSDRLGIGGLRDYLAERREADFVDNLCRKLIAYALGRSLLPSDEALVENMKQRLAADEGRMGNLIEAIVTSRQFLNKRGNLTRN